MARRMSDILKEAREAYTKAYDAAQENHDRALEDLRFSRLGEQWPDNIRRMREAEQRPILTINKMPTFIRQVVNDARQNKPQIKVHPVDDKADPQTSLVLNGLIRNIEVQSNADAAYDTAVEHAVSMGFGYFRINIEYAHDDTFDRDITIERITNPLTVLEDPNAESVDGSDWMYCFVTETVTKEEFKKRYPNADFTDFDATLSDDDRVHWMDDEKVRIAEYWKREEVEDEIVKFSNGDVFKASELDEEIDEGISRLDDLLVMGAVEVDRRKTKSFKVTQTILNGVEVLEEHDWPGRWIPIVPVYGDEVIERGKRHFLSLIHFAKDPQRMLNYWRSTTTELVALQPKAPWVGAVGSFTTDNRWDTANTENHAFLEYDPVIENGVAQPPPMRQPFAGIPAGALQEAMSAADDIMATTGLYQASLGEKSNERSGVAITARQREGDTSTFHFIDNMSRAIRQAGRIIVNLIPYVYSDARIVRVLGEDESPSNIPVNQPVTPRATMEDPNPEPRVFDLTAGKYDVTVKSGPSYTTQRMESADQMLQLITAFPPAAPLLGDLLAKNLDWPQADEIEKRLKTLVPQTEDPRLQQAGQMIQQLQAEIQRLKGEQAREDQKVRNDTREVEIKAFDAQTDRMEALAKIQREIAAPLPGTTTGY